MPEPPRGGHPRASEWYVQLDTVRCPAKERQQQGGQDVDAHLFHVVVTDAPAAVRLIEQLDEVAGLVVVIVGDDVPAWAPERTPQCVRRPAAADAEEETVTGSRSPEESSAGSPRPLVWCGRVAAEASLQSSTSTVQVRLVFVRVDVRRPRHRIEHRLGNMLRQGGPWRTATSRQGSDCGERFEPGPFHGDPRGPAAWIGSRRSFLFGAFT